MSNDKNVFERLWKLEASVKSLVLNGQRDPHKVANILQGIVSETGSVTTTFDRNPNLKQKKPAPKNLIRGTVMYMDRSTPLTYPGWVQEPLHPELEGVGPAKYNFKKVKLWLHDEQKNGGVVTGDVIFDDLETRHLLKHCYGLEDALAIQKTCNQSTQAFEVFRKVFGSNVIYCWKSAVRGRGGYRYVPCFYDIGDGVVVNWHRLGGDWGGRGPAACFASFGA